MNQNRKSSSEHWKEFKILLKSIGYTEIVIAIISIALIYPILNVLIYLFQIKTYNFTMFAEFDIQLSIFMTVFLILSIWNILTQLSIFIKNKEFTIKIILILLTLTSAFILTLVYLMPKILKQMMEYSTGIPMFSTLDVIKNSIIISLLITLGIGLMFLIPLIHKYIIDLSFIQKARPMLYIILIITSMVITPTGDAFTMMATLVPMSIGTEIGLYQCKKKTEE
jgi:hypothetical protein